MYILIINEHIYMVTKGIKSCEHILIDLTSLIH